jgi:chromosome condensin MukBEF complex kleisin-like MukF subunit
MVRKKTAQEIARDEAWEKCKYEGDEQFEADPFEMFNEGWQAAIASQQAEIDTFKTELSKLQDLYEAWQAHLAAEYSDPNL